MAGAGRKAGRPRRGLTSRFCGQRIRLIQHPESKRSTGCRRVVHRPPGRHAQRGHFGRLPDIGFRGNVNTPRDTAARKSGETRASSGSVRLSDPGSRPSSEARNTGQGPGPRPGSSEPADGNRTGIVGEDGGDPASDPADLSREGAADRRRVRPQAERQPPLSMAKSNPDLVRGRRNGSTGRRPLTQFGRTPI